MRRLALLLVLMVMTPILASGRAQGDEQLPITLPLLLGRAAWYVEDFVTGFSNVVAEETYVQDSNLPLPSLAANSGRGAGAPPVPLGLLISQVKHRVLRSDFLLATIRGTLDWVPFRDVFEVDKVPVRDRAERLSKLFLRASADSMQQAQRIRDESARYNLGTVRRTINNPMLGVAVLEADFQDRFKYTLGRKDPAVGPNVWTVDYREEQRPTLIKGPADADLFSHGRLWIDADTGRLLKSEFAIDQPSVTGAVRTTYRLDNGFGLALPREMREEYRLENGTRLTGVATYDHFRRFGVTTSDSLKQ